jgi:hypothetical protein
VETAGSIALDGAATAQLPRTTARSETDAEGLAGYVTAEGRKRAALMAIQRGFIDNWRPQQKTLRRMAQVLEILSEYEQQLPLTIRQIFYRLVARYEYEKTINAYSNLSQMLTTARRARWETNEGMLLFEAIRDDSFTAETASFFKDEAEFWQAVRNTAKRLRLDRMIGQERRLALWCESAGMIPQMRRLADPYGITVYNSGGFDKVTGKYEVAKAFSFTALKQPITVLHIGDHDPSGIHIFETLSDDVIAFAQTLAEENDFDAPDIEFVRVAVIPEQAHDLALPTALPNANDQRRFDEFVVRHSSLFGPEYLDNDPDESWQAEALDPATLAQIVNDAIKSHINEVTLTILKEHEAKLREAVQKKLEKL